MTELGALDARVTRVEREISDLKDQISIGFDKIETLIRQEINDLKKEQIDDLKKVNERLADDQRRLWDRVVELERRENRRVGDQSGQHRVLGALWAFLMAAAGGFITWLVTWLTSSGGSPPPHH